MLGPVTPLTPGAQVKLEWLARHVVCGRAAPLRTARPSDRGCRPQDLSSLRRLCFHRVPHSDSNRPLGLACGKGEPRVVGPARPEPGLCLPSPEPPAGPSSCRSPAGASSEQGTCKIVLQVHCFQKAILNDGQPRMHVGVTVIISNFRVVFKCILIEPGRPGAGVERPSVSRKIPVRFPVRLPVWALARLVCPTPGVGRPGGS